ncbi:MAG: ferritin family protein [Spirochaetales bacterium]|nr:ferritin family protein [Spirochaetales bacterium]
MSIIFNADEIFQIAIQIEKNGTDFYNRAAEITKDTEMKNKFLNLAKMETEHEKTFAHMHSQLSSAAKEPTVWDPSNELALYLQAFAKGHVFSVKPDGKTLIKDSDTVKDILKMAINLEIESIALYTGLEDLVPEKLGKAEIKKIIRQEMVHVQILSGELEAL